MKDDIAEIFLYLKRRALSVFVFCQNGFIMKKWFFLFLFSGMFFAAGAQNRNDMEIKLEAPDLSRGKAVMQALSERQSTREFSDKELSIKDLSDLLWAANGINRPESGKRTAPSALNRQDVKVYVCMKSGSYLYEPGKQTLVLLSEGDARPVDIAPVCLVLVADSNEMMAAIDAGIVSQNVSLFCSGTGLATVPRASMDKAALREALKLSDKQEPMLNHPVGYFK